MNSPFFVVGCARSGTTSLCRILDQASNGDCLLEPSPNLAWESREVMEGRMTNSLTLVQNHIVPRIRDVMVSDRIYGEKNITFAPFIGDLFDTFDCNFVFIHRDGRDVIRSLINWHEQKFGNIYRECRDHGLRSSTARTYAGGTLLHADASDHSRPRPMPGDPHYEAWEDFSRFEMCAYYWSKINDVYLSELGELPSDRWIDVEYTSPNAEEIMRVAEFCSLRGLSIDKVESSLNARINSLSDELIETSLFPKWHDWNGWYRRRFSELCQQTTSQLNDASYDGVNWKPENYGKFWLSTECDTAWYQRLNNSRMDLRACFKNWFLSLPFTLQEKADFAEFGAGRVIDPPDFLRGKKYVAVDMSSNATLWSRENNQEATHHFVSSDFISEALERKVDIVFSFGGIDYAYDIDQMLTTMVKSAVGYIYLIANSGWFPSLDEHKYKYDPLVGLFENQISPKRVREKLLGFGCSDIVVQPLNHSCEQTLIVAKVSDNQHA